METIASAADRWGWLAACVTVEGEGGRGVKRDFRGTCIFMSSVSAFLFLGQIFRDAERVAYYQE